MDGLVAPLAVDDLESATTRRLDAVRRFLAPGGEVAERQLPFHVAFVVACATLLLPLDVVEAPGAIAAAILVVVVEAVLASVLPWHRYSEGAAEVLPILQILAVAAFRAGTGNVLSPYTTMLFLPVVGLASQRGRRGVAMVALLAFGLVLVPAVFNAGEFDERIVVRGFYLACVCVIVALTVHGVTERLRKRTAAVAQLRAVEQRLLERTRTDAMELARVADARRATRDMLGSIIDAATEQAIVAVDADGVVEVFNAGAERLLGYRSEDVVGRMRVTDFHLREEIDERRAELYDDTSVVDNPRTAFDVLVAPALLGRADVREWTWVRADRSEVTVLLTVTRRVDTDGTFAGFVGVATDVTEQRETERLKEEFVSLVSHELRTPLSSVLGYLELVQTGPDPLTDEQREFLGVIERNARRQLRLVSDLLLTAQLEAGTFALAPQRTDVAVVVAASAESLTPAAGSAGVRIEVEAEPVWIEADPVRLAQVVDNLVTNAVKFTPRGGVVRLVLVGTPDGGAELTVSDTGIGIPQDELARLTHRFFRGSAATVRAVQGVGLGLGIADAVVSAHGGTVDVTSTVGVGTVFTVRLPAAPRTP